jgi:hypothetical protein
VGKWLKGVCVCQNIILGQNWGEGGALLLNRALDMVPVSVIHTEIVCFHQWSAVLLLKYDNRCQQNIATSKAPESCDEMLRCTKFRSACIPSRNLGLAVRPTFTSLITATIVVLVPITSEYYDSYCDSLQFICVFIHHVMSHEKMMQICSSDSNR